METKRQLQNSLPTTTQPIPKEGATFSNGFWGRETRFRMDLDAFGDTLRFVVWPSLPPLSLVNTQSRTRAQMVSWANNIEYSHGHVENLGKGEREHSGYRRGEEKNRMFGVCGMFGGIF